jgi:spoIIIJ-associated protein
MAKVKKEKKVKDGGLALLQEATDSLLGLMGTTANASVSEDKDNDSFIVDIDAKDESGLLIGKRGETINSMQMILGMIFRQKTGGWKRILVNVADWRDKQETRLKELALQAAQRVRETGEEEQLYNLTPGQRRTIHLFLANEEDVITESVGEGNDRYLIVKPK